MTTYPFDGNYEIVTLVYILLSSDYILWNNEAIEDLITMKKEFIIKHALIASN